MLSVTDLQQISTIVEQVIDKKLDEKLKPIQDTLDDHTAQLHSHTHELNIIHMRIDHIADEQKIIKSTLHSHTKVLGTHTKVLEAHTKVLKTHTTKLNKLHDGQNYILEEIGLVHNNSKKRLDRIEEHLDLPQLIA